MGMSYYNFEEENRKIMTKIMSLCKEKGISQNELARRAEISNGTLSNLLSGKSKATLYTIYKILNALNVKTEDIFGYTELSLSKEEQMILRDFRKSSNAKKLLMIKIVNEIALFKDE